MDARKLHMVFVFILIGLLISCVKDPQDIPTGFSADSSFGMKASFGNESIDIEAGKNLWTMLPVVGQEDSLNVYTAVLSQDGCLEQCAPSWSFRFFQSLPLISDPTLAFSNTLDVGEKDLVMSNLELDSFDVLLTTHPGLFMSGFSYWEDLNDASATSFFHEFQSTVGYQQTINVCFQSLAFTGCQYTQCIYFDPATQVPCLVSIEAKLESPRHVSLSVRPMGTPPFQYEWYNGATTPSIVVTLQDSTVDIHAEVTVIDALGNRSDLSQTILLLQGVVDPCYVPISLTSLPVENESPSVKADRMEFVYQDKNGVNWRSSGGLQPAEAGVYIDQVSFYGVSPIHQKTSLIEARITALLFNENTGESKLFQTERLSLALSHQ